MTSTRGSNQMYRGTHESFFSLPIVKTAIEEDHNGDLVRVEVRKDPETGLTIKGRYKVPSGRR